MKVETPAKLSHGLTLDQARDYIQSADLSPVIERLISVDGWSRKSALKAVQLYRNYLFIRKKYNELLPPSYEIDEAWHAHVLHTEAYVEFCNDVFGTYLHHHPHMVKHGRNVNKLVERFEKTQEFYKQEFGDYIYQIKRRPIKFRPLLRKIFNRPYTSTFEGDPKKQIANEIF